MNRLNFEPGKSMTAPLLLAVVFVVCCIVPSITRADDDKKIELRKDVAAQGSYVDKKKQTNASSASASSSSSSQSDSRGRTRSNSRATATATGNASAASSAKGSANAVQTKNGQDPKSSKSASSASAKANVSDDVGDRYQNREGSDQASATTSVTSNGVKISRSVDATEAGKVTTLEVISKADEIRMREKSDGSLEVRVRDRKKNANGNVDEKVYLAKSRDDLMKQSPKLVRRIRAYEKIVGTTKASVNTQGAAASGDTAGGKFAAPNGNQDRKAKQMLKQQLEKTLQQNAGNPEIQKLIRKMLQDIDR